jgi:hypothetical protein
LRPWTFSLCRGATSTATMPDVHSFTVAEIA